MTTNSTVLALDVGERRIGVAIASTIARLPRPLTTLNRQADSLKAIQALITEHEVVELVVGLPRGLNGQETEQTKRSRQFSDELSRELHIPVHLQDEAVTSKQAEAEFQERKVPYNKEDVDALAAVYILDDFLSSHQGAV